MANNLVDTLANYALKYGLWTDTDPSKKIILRDNEGKVAKIDYGQAAKNFGASTINAADFLGNMFLKPSDKVASNTNNEILTEARNNTRKVVRNMGWIGKAIDLAFGVSDATGLSGSASKTGKFKTDFLNGLSVFVPFSGAAGKNAGEYFENDNVNRTSYATIGNLARLHSKGNFWSGGEEIALGIDMANLQTHITDKNILEPTKRDLRSSMNDMWNTDVNFKVRQGGWDYNNAYHIANSKNGSVLKFTRRTLSKHKVKKQLSGGKVSMDYINSLYEPRAGLTLSQIDANNELWNSMQSIRDAYNKQIEDPNFLQDWIPSKLSWRDYWEQNLAKYSGDDNNVFNAVFGGDWDLSSDYFDSFYFNLMPNAEYNDDSELLQYYKTLNDDLIRDLYRNIYRIAANYRNPSVYQQGGKFLKEGGNINEIQDSSVPYMILPGSPKNLPDYIHYNPLDGYFSTDIYGDSSKEELKLLEDFVKNNFSSNWKLWWNPYSQEKQYVIVPAKIANLLDWKFKENLPLGASDSTISKYRINEWVPIEGKMLKYIGEDEDNLSENGNPVNFVDEDGNGYYYPAYKDGGKVNVIPEGALHKNKHHLETTGKFEKGLITNKGIPVIVETKDGEIIQQAEVEREEIIFRLEVTKKLEELSKKHTDEAAIAAGKLLVKEILYNTIDNTNNMI